MSILFKSGPIRTQVCLRTEPACKQTNKFKLGTFQKPWTLKHHAVLKCFLWVRYAAIRVWRLHTLQQSQLNCNYNSNVLRLLNKVELCAMFKYAIVNWNAVTMVTLFIVIVKTPLYYTCIIMKLSVMSDQNASNIRVDSRDLQTSNTSIWRYHCLWEVAFLKISNQYWLPSDTVHQRFLFISPAHLQT